MFTNFLNLIPNLKVETNKEVQSGTNNQSALVSNFCFSELLKGLILESPDLGKQQNSSLNNTEPKGGSLLKESSFSLEKLVSVLTELSSPQQSSPKEDFAPFIVSFKTKGTSEPLFSSVGIQPEINKFIFLPVQLSISSLLENNNCETNLFAASGQNVSEEGNCFLVLPVSGENEKLSINSTSSLLIGMKESTLNPKGGENLTSLEKSFSLNRNAKTEQVKNVGFEQILPLSQSQSLFEKPLAGKSIVILPVETKALFSSKDALNFENILSQLNLKELSGKIVLKPLISNRLNSQDSSIGKWIEKFLSSLFEVEKEQPLNKSFSFDSFKADPNPSFAEQKEVGLKLLEQNEFSLDLTKFSNSKAIPLGKKENQELLDKISIEALLNPKLKVAAQDTIKQFWVEGEKNLNEIEKLILNQLTESFHSLKSVARSEMQLILKPEYLGTVKLKLSVEDSSVKALMQVENPEVKRIVQANLPQLKQALCEQGLKIEQCDVSLSNGKGWWENQSKPTWENNLFNFEKKIEKVNQAPFFEGISVNQNRRSLYLVDFLA
jgi:hypothetical protein